MARTRRKITSGKPYELILRVSDRVPFIALELVKILLESALARTQRDNKVLICHHLWMGNHVHFIIVPLDPQQCVNFFQELQKKVTESYKSLTGQRSLKLWDGSAVLAEILDLDKAIEKIAYAYANPATANLTDKIEEYPGLSSFTQFLNANNSIDASFEIEVPYIRLYNIEPLKSLKVTEQEDRIYSQKLRNRAKRKHKLTLHFNAWIRAFGITDEKEVEYKTEQSTTELK